jgi:FtsP/CotA-like multicopper oxidase with cupredoxin domain
MGNLSQLRSPALVLMLIVISVSASAQTYQGGGSFRVQCPNSTITHPSSGFTNTTPDSQEVPYTGPVLRTVTKDPTGKHTYNPALTFNDNGGAIKCQEVSGGDGFMTEADGNQTFMFAFGPLSGLGLIAHGLPGTQFAADFNIPYTAGPNFNDGQPNPAYVPGTDPLSLLPGANGAITDPAAIMNTGVLNGSIPAPLIAFDEDDEMFLTLSNVGMIMRPDLFEQHTIHFHGYPNASSFYDGVPDASVAINIGGSFTYYYLAPDAGTYFWHCHITPPEHLQMGMVGQLYVRPRQNRVPSTMTVYQALVNQQNDPRTACNVTVDILCSNPLPNGHVDNLTYGGFVGGVQTKKFAYNDGDGSTQYDIDVPIQIHGFDPNFHFVGMTFNPEGFSDMKDKYFLLNGRSYPDTVGVVGYPGGPTRGNPANGANTTLNQNPDPASGAISTAASDGYSRPSQPLPTLVTLKQGQKALLRIADLDVTEYQTLASIGIPMKLIGFNAKLLRDQDGNNLYVTTNSITLGGGESLDVILDSTGIPPGTYFLYTTNLDHLSNDAENFGGLMTEVVVN